MSENGFTRRTLLGGVVAGGLAAVSGDRPAPEIAPTAAGRSTVVSSQFVRASAITTTSDPWLPDGTHLRVNVASRLGLPLHPFTAFRVDVAPWRASGADVMERPSTHVWLGPDLSVLKTGGGITTTGASDVRYLLVHGWQWTFQAVRCCFVRLVTRSGSAFRVDVLDPATRLPDDEPTVLASRAAAPYEFGGADLTLLRLRGAGTVDVVEIVSTESPYLVIDPARAVSFGLPTGAGPWYVPDPSADPAT
ncbi:MAG: hypothetical protein HOV94_21780, partial [Saccharothrix sp.]|nr:hypothetical protein [Saccharothrix sp.]